MPVIRLVNYLESNNFQMINVKSTLIGTGYYFLGLAVNLILIFNIFISVRNANNDKLIAMLIFIPPLIVALNKNILRGLLIQAIVMAILNYTIPKINSFVTPTTSVLISKDNQVDNLIDGVYSIVTDGVKIELSVSGNSWLGETKSEYTDELINTGSGKVDGNKLFGEYGLEVGQIQNGVARINIGGYEFRLTK